jgi:annexin A7/11
LKKAGVGRLGTDEAKFNRIFAAESFDQLRAIFDEYHKLTGHDIEKAIKNEMSGDVMNAYLALAKLAKYPPRYFAERIGKSMIGLGTQEDTLIRNIILRSEIDMREIKIEFQKLYSKSLESFIKGDCSGDFEKALLCIVRDQN